MLVVTSPLPMVLVGLIVSARAGDQGLLRRLFDKPDLRDRPDRAWRRQLPLDRPSRRQVSLAKLRRKEHELVMSVLPHHCELQLMARSCN
jgi:hypothetical protein